MLGAQHVVEDLGDRVRERRGDGHEREHKPGAVRADLQPVPRAQRLRDNLSCSRRNRGA